MPEKSPQLLPDVGAKNVAAGGVFTFRVLQVTEALAFGEGARTCVSVFGEVFQRTEADQLNSKRISSGRVEFQPNERDDAHVGSFSFPKDTEVQPFLLAYVNVRPSAMQGLIETLRSGPGIELAFRAEDVRLLDTIISDEQGADTAQSIALRTVSVSVSR